MAGEDEKTAGPEQPENPPATGDGPVEGRVGADDRARPTTLVDKILAEIPPTPQAPKFAYGLPPGVRPRGLPLREILEGPD
ncbi:uncharacterized protein N7458_001232 [Penicillium daleae]|uniref:Uncharacterized protein n=1 Tax=Penicillium daleae TaxID=63821 RepID=A0AAD6CD27_9EURO|nr:uncharacterized protein N7458_001232 [Penicillium daleae]KAJ5459680.1 hypothetical protein N7458_001232 [Penicillium daleae]